MSTDPARIAIARDVLAHLGITLADLAAATARPRRNGRHGRHAGEHVIAAARAIYNRAAADGHLHTAASPAHRVAKPRRLPSTRRALTTDELDQINTAARTSGNDTILDALLLRLHTETACRRGGALTLRLADLDVHNCLIRLDEKGDTQRWQPVSPLTARLAEHAGHRGAVNAGDALLRYRDGHPLTSRRYDHLWSRLGRRLPWVATHGISTHRLRHTTLTWVERRYDRALPSPNCSDVTYVARGAAGPTYTSASWTPSRRSTSSPRVTCQPSRRHR